MRAILQRVSRGSVSVDGKTISSIGAGYVILLGIGHQDTPEIADELARKTTKLRVFQDEQEKMNLSVLDTKGSILVISQFTLYADTRKGNRPSFIDAALPEKAAQLVDVYCDYLRQYGVNTLQGVFGAHMKVDLVNDGPVTIFLEVPSSKDQSQSTVSN